MSQWPTFPLPPISGHGCEEAASQALPHGFRRHHEDLCQPIAMLPTLRHPIEYPPDDLDGQWSLGRFEPRSTVTVRAVDGLPPQGMHEKCHYHYGRTTMNKNGKMVPFHCSQPSMILEPSTLWADDFRRNHRMAVARLETDDPEGIIPRGRFFFVGQTSAPWWADAHLNSTRIRCITPPQ